MGADIVDDLVIYGAGGLGRELLEIIEEINAVHPTWNILGFADDGIRTDEGMICGYPLLGGREFFRSIARRTAVLLGFADCAAKEDAYGKITSFCRDFYFPVIVHPYSYVSPRATLADGAVIARFCSVHVSATVGRCALVSNKCEISHDSAVGDFVSLMPSVNISGNVDIGKKTFIGVQAAVLQGVTIGSDAIVGMGSVVLSDVPEGCTVVGSPAKIISRRSEDGNARSC